jgi:Tol biopolymer transport system component
VTRRVAISALALSVGVLLLAVGAAGAAAPDGPRLAAVRWTVEPSRDETRMEILTLGPGRASTSLIRGAERAFGPSRPLVEFFSPISWAPDGSRLAFTGVVAFRNDDDHEPVRRVFVVRSDGAGLHPIDGTNGAQAPLFSPDGRTIAFTRSIEREVPTRVGGKLRKEGFAGSSIWTVDLAGGRQRQLTPWREGLHYVASSFSPDGSTLLATFHDRLLTHESQPVALQVDSGARRPIFDDGFHPVYSPDGSRIALVRRVEEYGEDREEDTELFVLDADGTGLRRLTRTPGRYELYPSWDPSGERLAYIRFSAAETEAAAFGFGNALMQVNADGSCPTRLASAPRTAFYAPAWQPGAGREAGRIEC